MKVIGTESSQILAASVATGIGCGLSGVRFSRFPDGELYLRRNPIDDDTVIIGSITGNDALVQLLLLADACAGSRITLIIPYMGYARQDKIFHDGEALSARAIARAVSRGIDRVFTINIHDPSILGHFVCPATNLSLAPAIAEYIAARGLQNPLILAPDDGALAFAGDIARVGGWECDHLDKTRFSGDDVAIAPKVLPVDGRDVVMVDDIISTGGTFAAAAGVLKDQGARDLHAVCVHGVFTTGAYASLIAAGIRDIACSDTIERACSHVSAANAIADAVRV